jgi:hypothetical protein
VHLSVPEVRYTNVHEEISAFCDVYQECIPLFAIFAAATVASLGSARPFGKKFRRQFGENPGTFGNAEDFSPVEITEEIFMKYALIFATVAAIATPALADDVGVGVGVGPVGAGVTVGQTRDHDRDRTTVIKEREPAERTTVIKKEHEAPRSKTIIKARD